MRPAIVSIFVRWIGWNRVSISGSEVDPRVTGAVTASAILPRQPVAGRFTRTIKSIKSLWAVGCRLPIVTAPADTIFAWAPDGAIAFLDGDRLLRVPPDGGKPTTIAEGLTGRIQSLQVLPGGKTVLLTRFPPDALECNEFRSTGPFSRHRARRCGRQRRPEAMYVPTGHLIYYSNGHSWRQSSISTG
jgi:hypothetical protein